MVPHMSTHLPHHRALHHSMDMLLQTVTQTAMVIPSIIRMESITRLKMVTRLLMDMVMPRMDTATGTDTELRNQQCQEGQS
jgi:CheY-like chemotaxis protein